MPALLIALAVVVWIQPGLALAQEDGLDALFTGPCSEAGGRDRFRLCNACRPMEIVVEDLDKDTKAIGLTRDRLQVTAESRLRAARLYTEDSAKANGTFLYVRAAVLGRAWSLHVKYFKTVSDPVSGETRFASTWPASSFGTHTGNPGYIIQVLSENLDKFLVEYVRVNEKDCPR